MNVQPTYETACIIDASYELLPDPHCLPASSQGNHYPEFLKNHFNFSLCIYHIYIPRQQTYYLFSLVFQ